MTGYPTYRWVLICLYLMSNVSAQMVINTLGILLPSIAAGLGLSPSQQGLLGSGALLEHDRLGHPYCVGRFPRVAQVAHGGYPGGLRPVPVPAKLGSGVRRPAAGEASVRHIHHRPATGPGHAHAPVVPASARWCW